MIVLGLIVVPIALPFRKEVESDRFAEIIHMPDGRGVWRWTLVNLPKWAWPWGNKRDGCLGDIRGDYRFEQSPKWLRHSEYLLAFYWLAIRNPCNNFSRYTEGIAVDMKYATATTLSGQDVVKDRPGQEGYQFIHARGFDGLEYYGFYLVKRYGNRFLVIRLGHKMDIDDNGKEWPDETKSWKGFTFRAAFERIDG